MMMMESRGSGGGCCVARYESEKMDRIMLRFRPIAPKPIAGGSSPKTVASGGGGDPCVKVERAKRRYNNNKNSDQKSCSKRRKTSPEVVTLPLLPEMIETGSRRSTPKAPIWLNFNSGTAEKDKVDTMENIHRPMYYTPDPTVVIPPRVTCGTCVTLECLTYTMVNVDALGRTDKERVMNLERGTCPGFVSDRLSRITWSNEAFSKMVDFGGAWVAMKESVAEGVRAFSCRVRVQVENKTTTVPCDVWRMDCGGFAWRLDVKAALSLAL